MALYCAFSNCYNTEAIMRYIQHLIIGIILCIIVCLAAVQMESLLSQILVNRSLKQVVSIIIYDLSLYIIAIALYKSFKIKLSFTVLMMYWISMDFISYSNIALGWEKHAFFVILTLITLTYFAIQHKRNVSIITSFGIMVLFQIAMLMDWFNGDSKTILYSNYHCILTGVHFLIISTLINWSIIARIRAYINYYFQRVSIVFGQYLVS